MAVTQNTYTGNGSTVLFSFTFPYLETTDIKVSVNGTNTTAYTLANPTTVQFNAAPANGAAIRIYRQTDDAATAATFYPGSSIRAQDLNENFTQNLYVTQESSNNAASATTTANTALTNSNTAISTANTALSTANTASSNASAAVSTANTASTNASAAVSTANTASTNATSAVNTANAASATAASAASDAATAISTANSAVSTANAASSTASTALSTANSATSTANSAVSTANTAATNASNAVTTANTASSNATSAVNTANTANTKADAAIAAISSSAVFTPVANVAAIPGSPTNGQNIQVTDSTGIESFTPLAGLPVGFVGDSGIAARIQYSGGTWNWFGYFATNSDARYLKTSGGTLTGQLKADDSTSTASPVYAFDGDTNTGIAHTGADELALVTGGTARLTVDPAGAVAIGGSLSVGGQAAVVTNDARLSNTRTPTDGSVTNAKVAAGAGIEGSKIQAATTSNAGAVQLTDSTSSTSTTTAATPNAVKTAFDTATSAQTTANSKLSAYTVTTTGISKTLANRERCTVTASGLTITLPASPSAGWEVSITVAGTFTDTTIARNGTNIMSLAENMTIDKGDITVTLYYVDATRGWRVI
jgi:chemotaxis protein histidine kinase CheA